MKSCPAKNCRSHEQPGKDLFNMRYLIFFFLLLSFSASAQWKSFILSPRGDTLNRVDQKDLKQGPWVVHVDELRGERGYEEEGYFVDGKKEGPWRRYSLEGDLIALENYRWGYLNGKNVYFTRAGEPLREEYWRAIDPKNPYDTVDVYDVNDPDKIIRKEIVKVDAHSVKHGTWKYYDNYGGKVETEKWVMGKLKTEEPVVDGLAPIDVANHKSDSTAVKKKVTKPKEVLEFEKKNAGKKKIKVRDGSTGGY